MPIVLVAFLALVFAAGLAAALRMGEARRFLIISAVVIVLVCFAASEALTLQAQLAQTIDRTIPAALR